MTFPDAPNAEETAKTTRSTAKSVRFMKNYLPLCEKFGMVEFYTDCDKLLAVINSFHNAGKTS